MAGFGTWQALGRHVDRGQKGIQILAPIYRRRRDGDAPDDAGAEDRGEFSIWEARLDRRVAGFFK